ncbi:MAG: hypothetical protein KC419_19340, partial [Anaerolineales bacterium]|nr:hypothetical protein [Anaerolineales bacterium]
MPLELVYFWVVSLLVIVGLLYLWMRLRVRRQQIEHVDAVAQPQDWFARLVYAVVEIFKRPSSPDSLPDAVQLADAEHDEVVADWSAPVSPDALRLPVTVMLVGSVLLVWMGQTLYSRVPPVEQRAVIFLMVLGGLAFLWAGSIARQQRVPRRLVPGVRRLCAYFEIQAGQLLLLLFAPLFV